MKRPSFQFYPADWTSSSKLRRCTFEEKGVWIELLILMHDQEENYGILRWNLKEISSIIGCKIKVLRSLIDKGVLKGADEGEICQEFVYIPRSGRKDGPPVTLIETQMGPIFFSSRLVTDEHKSKSRGGSSDTSPNHSPNHSPNPPFGDTFDEHQTIHHSRARPSSSSSASSSATKILKTTHPPKKKSSAKTCEPFELPIDIPSVEWDSWMEVRKKKGATFTAG